VKIKIVSEKIVAMLFVLLLVFVIGCGESASGSGPDSGGSTVKLTLDPQGKGYFKYLEKEYNSITTVEVATGEYLYFYRKPVETISGAASGWELCTGGIKTTNPINADMSASFKTVVLIKLTLDPQGQGYFKYNGIEYHASTTVDVIPGEILYFYFTPSDRTGYTFNCASYWFGSGMPGCWSEPIMSDTSISCSGVGTWIEE